MIRALLLTACLATFCGGQAQVTWKRSYGGLGSDLASDIAALPDGGAVICGSTGSFGASSGDMYVFRVDQNGILIWSRLLGGSGVDQGKAILALDDGSILAIGTTTSFGNGGYDGFVVRLSAEGEVIWERSFGGEEWDFLEAGSQSNEGYYLAGQTFSGDVPDGQAWVIHILPDGTLDWSLSTGWASDDEASGIVSVGVAGCAIGGTRGLEEEGADLFLMGINTDGEVSWTSLIEEPDRQRGRGLAMAQDGGFLLTGYTQDETERRRMYLVRSDVMGAAIWARTISSAGNDWEANDVKELEDGRLCVTGYTREYGAGGKDISLLFLTEDGDFLSGPTYGGNSDDEAFSLDLADDGAVFLAGRTNTYGPGLEAAFVIRSDGDTLNGSVVVTSDAVGIGSDRPLQEAVVFPNPASSGGVVRCTSPLAEVSKITVSDLSGQILMTSFVAGGAVHLPPLQNGMYIVHWESAGLRLRSKLLIE